MLSTDTDECTTGYHVCSHTCHNLPGSYECMCPSGFNLQDSYTCRDVDECATGLDQCDLLSGATCRNTDGSYSCLCHDGYKTDDSGFLCIGEWKGIIITRGVVTNSTSVDRVLIAGF